MPVPSCPHLRLELSDARPANSLALATCQGQLCRFFHFGKQRFPSHYGGRFWQNRFRAVRLLDEESILACAAYVDLNPIRAAVAQRLEESDYTSALRRTQALLASLSSENQPDSNPLESNPVDSISQPVSLADSFLAPLEIDELHDELGPRPSVSGTRCSDKGFLSMPVAAYLELLDWTARQLAAGKQGSTPTDTPAIFERLQIRPEVWCKLVSQFGQLFSL